MGVITLMRIFFLLLLMMNGIGCGILSGEKISHVNACGPIAIQEASSDLGIEADLTSISEEIKKDGSNCLRGFFSIFNSRAQLITFPWEIEDFFIKRGYRVAVLYKLDKLDKEKDVAVVLIQEGISFSYHWMAFPDNSKLVIENYFGKDTEIHYVLVIKKK